MVSRVIIGIAPVAGGLVISTGLKLAISQPQKLEIVLFSIIIFVLLIILHWSLWVILLCSVPLALLSKWYYFSRYK
jgi:chromate transporter